MGVDLVSLLIISCVAVVAPLIAELPLRRRLPAVVVEIGLGIAIGPQGMGLTSATGALGFLGVLGMAFLFFLAGFEIDFARIRGRPSRLAALGWITSLGVAASIAIVLHVTGVLRATTLVTIALCTTSLGILLPIIRDSGLAETSFGTMVIAAGAAGEFGPILLMSLVSTAQSGRAAHVALLLAFSAIAVAGAVIAVEFHPPALLTMLGRGLHATTQLPVRVSVLLLVALVTVAQRFGLDLVVGAFAAGITVSLASQAEPRRLLAEKLDGIGFGFLVPIFFITSGIHFDLHALVASTSSLVRLPLFLLLFLVVRGLPALFYRRDLPRNDLAPFGFLSSTGLPVIVAITEIGRSTGWMRSDNAAALVGAGMVSVFLFPAAAIALRSRRPRVSLSTPVLAASRTK
jgi:Kef-type K+ transport system membrane component KefB